jgi:hypothetical protein
VATAVANTETFAQQCAELIATKGLAAALEHCKQLGYEPPYCSLTANSRHADKIRTATARKLSEHKWWRKTLRDTTIQKFEREQWAAGKVTNYVSDETMAYLRATRRF